LCRKREPRGDIDAGAVGYWVHMPDGVTSTARGDLPEERKEFLFDAAPEIFLKLVWGKSAKLIVQITKLSKRELESLMREAWESATPPAKPTKVRGSSNCAWSAQTLSAR
jgi:hypothetical protein